MSAEDRFHKVDEDFKLTTEVLTVVTDDDGGAEPVAVVFYRPDAASAHVEEYGPNAVDDALAFAIDKAAELGRKAVVQLNGQDIWWPHWGILD